MARRDERVARLVGANLRRFRRAADLTQGELAYRSGMSRSSILLFERGRRTPRIDSLIRLAGAVEKEPAEFVRGVWWCPVDDGYGNFHRSHWHFDGEHTETLKARA